LTIFLSVGLRLFDNNVKSTDATESAALVHKLDEIDIYSNSWGPGDMGYKIEGPGTLTSKALEHGANKVHNNYDDIWFNSWGPGNMRGE